MGGGQQFCPFASWIFLYLLPPYLYYPKMGCRNSHACQWCSILTTQSVFKEGSQNRTLMTCMAIPTPHVFYSDSPFHLQWSVRGRGAVGACLAWWWKRWRYGLVNDILVFYRWTQIFGPQFLDPDFWTPIFEPRFLDPNFWTPIFGPQFYHS